jgi:hypothetical protein
MMALASFAYIQRNEAIAQKNRAISNFEISNSLTTLPADPTDALRHALLAWRTDPTNIEAHQALLNAYYKPDAFPARLATKRNTAFETTIPWFGASFGKDSDMVLSYDLEQLDTLWIFNLKGERHAIKLEEAVSRLCPLAIFSPDSRNILNNT